MLLIVLFLFLLFLTFPFYTFDLLGPAYRFFLAAMILSSIFIPVLLNNTKRSYFITIVFLAVSAFSYKSYAPEALDPPYMKYERVVENSMKHINNNVELVIAHKALAEFFTFNTGIDALPWKAEAEVDKSKIRRLAYGVTEKDLKFYLKGVDSLFYKISSEYIFVDETIWQKFVEEVEASDDEYLKSIVKSWENPYKQRPQYLLRNKN